MYNVEPIDQADRNSLRHLCKVMGLIFDDEWYETRDFLTVPAWGRRFWFKRYIGVEKLERIEDFTP